MTKRNTPARDIQARESTREAKASCTARQHCLWQQIHDHRLPEKFNLTASETSTLLYLAVRCGMNTARSWSVSQAKIAAELRINPRTVQRATKRLAALGLFHVDAGRGRGHVHRYTFPADLAAIPAPAPKTYEKATQGRMKRRHRAVL